jgi:hypothetical protein
MVENLGHYHTEQNHQDLGNQLIATEPNIGGQNGQVERRDRLGGLLRYYSSDGVRHGGVFQTYSWECALHDPEVCRLWLVLVRFWLEG